ncbi:hypothetical protein [Streptomyces atroolivaceus]|uniref:hypothetical protein n=1 Tax=Streptomyces atroolivaceus TaxID=66869 RepID=UPI003D69264E
MSAVTDTPNLAPLKSRGAISRSVADSLVVARRNLIRMARIPNLVRQGGFQFNSSGRHDLRLSARMEGTQ